MNTKNLTQGDFLNVVVSFLPDHDATVKREGGLSSVQTNGDTKVRIEAVSERIEMAEQHVERAAAVAPKGQRFEILQVPVV